MSVQADGRTFASCPLVNVRLGLCSCQKRLMVGALAALGLGLDSSPVCIYAWHVPNRDSVVF